MSARLPEDQLIALHALRDAAASPSPSQARRGVPNKVRMQLFRQGLVNGAWVITPAGEAAIARQQLQPNPPRQSPPSPRRKPTPEGEEHRGRYGVGADRTTRVRSVTSGGLPSLGHRYS